MYEAETTHKDLNEMNTSVATYERNSNWREKRKGRKKEKAKEGDLYGWLFFLGRGRGKKDSLQEVEAADGRIETSNRWVYTAVDDNLLERAVHCDKEQRRLILREGNHRGDNRDVNTH